MNRLVILGLCLVTFVLLISVTESKPQLTFSTNWDGGKRSGNSDYNEIESLYGKCLASEKRKILKITLSYLSIKRG